MEKHNTDNRNTETATNFSPETHVRIFEYILHIYGVVVHDWALCQVSDNFRVNKLVGTRARKIGIAINRDLDPNLDCNTNL